MGEVDLDAIAEYYVSRLSENRSWNPQPDDQWGVINGGANRDSEMPIVLGQRKDVPGYYLKQSIRLQGRDAPYNVIFRPAASRDEAERMKAQLVSERLAEESDESGEEY